MAETDPKGRWVMTIFSLSEQVLLKVSSSCSKMEYRSDIFTLLASVVSPWCRMSHTISIIQEHPGNRKMGVTARGLRREEQIKMVEKNDNESISHHFANVLQSKHQSQVSGHFLLWSGSVFLSCRNLQVAEFHQTQTGLVFCSLPWSKIDCCVY